VIDMLQRRPGATIATIMKGDGLAAALGAGLLHSGGAQETRLEPHVREERRGAGLQDCGQAHTAQEQVAPQSGMQPPSA
jgi:hypothetical protein